MKLIENKILSLSATSENSEFPASNLLDDYPRNLYQAQVGVQSASLTLLMPGGCRGFYLCNTNADVTAVLTVKTMANVVVETHELALGYYNFYNYLTANQPGIFTQIWQDYTYQEDDHKLIIDLETTEQTLNGGVTRAGIVHEFRNLNKGAQRTPKEIGVFKELADGGDYEQVFEILREWSGTLIVDFDYEYQAFMDYIYRHWRKPQAINIYNDYYQGLVFGKIFDQGDVRATRKQNIFNILIKEAF